VFKALDEPTEAIELTKVLGSRQCIEPALFAQAEAWAKSFVAT
jgi:hypothetical protein